MDEGYIKFNINWIKDKPVDKQEIEEINKWRKKLYILGFIGMYDNGIGFGNISIRYKNNFLITGSATGGLPELDENHYVVVTDYDLSKNSLTCKGPIKASSESLSHAVVYEYSSDTQVVVHVHNLLLWQKLLDKVPTTNKNVTYGTPEMADEIIRLFKETDVEQQKIICMAGHEEGIIIFGKNLDEAAENLLKFWK
ncbi:MAG: class II aldolase/adducin family protein [Bacteroidales bacterium]|nr:class II aldolase/adducin family protein [Bacteroidales bacterium]